MSNQRQRAEHFKSNYLAWVALSHFMSASLVREMSRVLVNEITDGELSLEQLFDERLPNEADQISSWVIRPIETQSPIAGYLQNRIRSLIWQHDAEAFAAPNGFRNHQGITPENIEAAARLGKQDLFVSKQGWSGTEPFKQASIDVLARAIQRMTERHWVDDIVSCVPEVIESFSDVQMPLKAVFLKHFGDLCADADAWSTALEFYEATETQVTKLSPNYWPRFIEILQVTTLQSRSAAARMLHGGKAVVQTIGQRLNEATMEDAPLFLLNASQDGMVGDILAAETFRIGPDRRASILLAPELLASHSTTSAIECWLTNDFANANQNFWAVLRRQIALGSASDTRITKAQYGACLLDEIGQTSESTRRTEAFWMALRLLLESGQTKAAKTISWNSSTVRRNLNLSVISQIIAHTNRHSGAKVERCSVAIECFASWIKLLTNDQRDVATQLMQYLVDTSLERKASQWGSQNVGGRSLELLVEISEERPDFRIFVAEKVSTIIESKLRSDDFWKPKSDAIKLAQVYLDVFSIIELRRVIAAVLEVLDNTDPSKEMWPIVQPAMDLLMSQSIPRISLGDPVLSARIISTILHFGLNQKSEHAHVLFFLQDFDLASLNDESVSGKLQEVVQHVQTQALATNASNASYNINALLYASKIVRRDGLEIAFEALKKILKSAESAHPSISLAVAYQSLRLLAERREQIVIDASISTDELASKLQGIFRLVILLWERAKDNSLLFAPFSIPLPNKPNSTIVHNWAYSSIGFAKSVGGQTEMIHALDNAEANLDLKNGIILAKATRLAGGDVEELNPENFASETTEAFYAALGQRLVRLRSAERHFKKQVLESLLEQCFQRGPRGLDAGVFLEASDFEMGEAFKATSYVNYTKLLDHDRELRLALFPMLNNLRKATDYEIQ